jgi:hypothetical protein
MSLLVGAWKLGLWLPTKFEIACGARQKSSPGKYTCHVGRLFPFALGFSQGSMAPPAVGPFR